MRPIRLQTIACVAYVLAGFACATANNIEAGVTDRDQPRVTAMPSTTVRIRIGNRSELAFERVVVRFGAQHEDYGRISAAAQSEYRTVEKAYRYAHVEVTVQGKTVAFRPIDYVGEKPLEPGDYTYAVSIVMSDGVPSRLDLSLVRD